MNIPCDDNLLATVDDKNNVVGFISPKKYLLAPAKYRLCVVRVIALTCDNRIVVTPSDREKKFYDTPYYTHLRYKEDYDDALLRVAGNFKEDVKFLMKYHHFNDTEDYMVLLHIVRLEQDSDRAVLDDEVYIDALAKVTDGVVDDILFEELKFFKKNIFPLLSLDNLRKD